MSKGWDPVTHCHESPTESLGKSLFMHILMVLASVLQGEPGLEGDSGAPGPDGVKVNLTLMARFSSHIPMHLGSCDSQGQVEAKEVFGSSGQ